MANPVEMVHTTGYTVPQDDQSWLINRITDGIREAQLDLSLFTCDKEKEKKYFASIDPDDFNAWLKSGIPVAKVTSTGLFGPYDPTATDGRQLKVAGFLESQQHVVFTRSGFENQYPTAGVRYMAVIDRNNLPVTLAEGTVFEGLILDYDKSAGGDVKVLSPSAGGDAKVLSPSAAGTAYKLPNATASALGGVKQAANVANLATSADAAAIVAAVNTLFVNLRTAGVMAAK